MPLTLKAELLTQIQAEGERAYPEEGAGFLLGRAEARRLVLEIMPCRNIAGPGTRLRRYLIDADTYAEAELQAERRELHLLGVFHSHPDHPAEPSSLDREWAQPNFSYIITCVKAGKAEASRSWLLVEDRSGFEEEPLTVEE